MQPAEKRRRTIASHARKLEEALQQLLPEEPNEATLRHEIEPILSAFCQAAEITTSRRDEYVVAEGKIADAVFDRLVVEFKRPGVLSTTRACDQATRQIKDYLQALEKKEKKRRLAGVVFDGKRIIFVRWRANHLIQEPPVDVTKDSIEKLLHWLSGLTSGAALTAENLNRDFTLEQERSRRAIGALFHSLTDSLLSNPNGMAAKLFSQWRLFFSEAIDYREALGGRKLEPLKKWVAKAELTVQTPEEAERFFFALHTYFALLVKLIAWLALSRHLGPRIGVPLFEELLLLPPGELRERLSEMEQGGIFRQFGIENLLEGDFFAWYLYGWEEPIEQAIRGVIHRLTEYDPATLAIDPDETRDLLKKLYHYLLPRQVRHNLGEYYTPDWLAQRLLNQVEQEFFTRRPVGQLQSKLREKLWKLRWLDPACGSGTFLVLLIKRYRELGELLVLPESELVNTILANVVGFDINPLAVITARVNYILALGDLLEHRKGPVTIPVYLADSVLLPELGQDLESNGLYQVRTSVGVFQVPQVVFAKGRFGLFCSLLEDTVKAEQDVNVFLDKAASRLDLSVTEQKSATEPLQALYAQLLELHKNGLDGLWARLLANTFAPLTVDRFDYVVGNPPWVNWENLPNGYRQSTAQLWKKYVLFPHKGFEAILGKSKDDISILMSYVVLDRFLRSGGRLGFVITQSVFKTAGAGQGFRRFRIGDRGESIRVVHVDDMVDINPFEGASNRTAVMVLEKGSPTRYPVPYTVWRKKGHARFTYDSTLEEVRRSTVTRSFHAEPVNAEEITSPWLTARRGALKAVRKVLGKSDYVAHAGVYTGGANAVYWVEIVNQREDGLVVVRNITEGAKRKVDEVVEAIEPDLLYPLLRGRDVHRWCAHPSAHILLTHKPGMRLKAIPEGDIQEDYPNIWHYLKRFEPILRKRAAFNRYFTRKGKGEEAVETGPFYSMFDIGDYTFSPWKVVWTRIAQVSAAVVGELSGRPILPQETVTLVATKSKEEAYYFSALVNSAPFQFAAASYSQKGGKSMGSMHVLEYIQVPKYDPEDSAHLKLAQVSKKAHEAAAQNDAKRVEKHEQEVDALAAQLWGLTEKELAEIHRSLAELEGKDE